MEWTGSYGLHTRLHYIINRAGGIDTQLRIEYLKKAYNISQQEAEDLFYCDFEDFITKYKTLEEAKKAMYHKVEMREKDKQEKRSIATRHLASIIGALDNTGTGIRFLESMKDWR